MGPMNKGSIEDLDRLELQYKSVSTSYFCTSKSEHELTGTELTCEAVKLVCEVIELTCEAPEQDAVDDL